MRSLLGIEQLVDLEHEMSQSPQFGQIIEHPAQPTAFVAVHMFGTRDDQVSMFPDEVGLGFLGPAATGTGPSLGLRWPATPALAPAWTRQFSAQLPQGIEE